MYSRVPSPCYVVEEAKLRANLDLIRSVGARAGVEMISALKACAMWSLFPIFREYIGGAAASSVAEARLVFEEMGVRAHTYAPVYTEENIEQTMQYSDHMTFNSVAQFERFAPRAMLRGISCGIRINPQFSSVDVGLYNPCSPGSRLGVVAEDLAELPQGLDGLHFHTLCESGADELEAALNAAEQRFGAHLSKIKWLNMGGGHLMTRKGYDIEKMVAVLQSFKAKYPNLRLIIESGSAYTWQTGFLISRIEDIVENQGIRTALLNTSFTCHMPDTLEMPYKPAVRGARDPEPGERGWRLGGNSCLAGDFHGEWVFEEEPQIGDIVIFEDMIHYTMVKTTMFNGVAHPSIGMIDLEGGFNLIREFEEFGYLDFRNRMS